MAITKGNTLHQGHVLSTDLAGFLEVNIVDYLCCIIPLLVEAESESFENRETFMFQHGRLSPFTVCSDTDT